MDSIDGFIVEVTTKRDAALTVFDNLVGYLKQIHGEIVRIAAEKDAQERLVAAERARHKSEMDRGRAEENELHLRIREARKELAQTVKQNDHQRAVGRAMFDNILGSRSHS
jgi:hypothetical protein